MMERFQKCGASRSFMQQHEAALQAHHLSQGGHRCKGLSQLDPAFRYNESQL
jgi:hypothetical protein